MNKTVHTTSNQDWSGLQPNAFSKGKLYYKVSFEKTPSFQRFSILELKIWDYGPFLEDSAIDC